MRCYKSGLLCIRERAINATVDLLVIAALIKGSLRVVKVETIMGRCCKCCK